MKNEIDKIQEKNLIGPIRNLKKSHAIDLSRQKHKGGFWLENYF